MNKILKEKKDLAGSIASAGGRAFYHAGRGSVTHTRQAVRTVLQYCAKVMQLVETEKTYAKRFETAIMQAQEGPVEVEIHGDTIFIGGNFDIAKLREFLLVNDPVDVLTIPVLGPEK